MNLKQFIIDNNIRKIEKLENDYRLSIYTNYNEYEDKYYWEFIKENRYGIDIILYKNNLSLDEVINLFMGV